MVEERLQKILSHAGVASRRTAEEMILAGRVSVNGQVRGTLGARADLDVDEVLLDGVPVVRSRYRYFLLNKPAGIVTTASDEEGRDTVLDLVPIGDIQLHPVGRLDMGSEGLLVLTNDGHLTALLTHPRHGVEKEYLVGLDAPVGRADLQRLVRGIEHGGDRLRAMSAMEVTPPPPGDEEEIEAAAWLVVVLREGKNREIRRMMEVLGRKVRLLRRTRLGPVTLGDLGSGAFRELTDSEVAALYGAGKRAEAQSAEIEMREHGGPRGREQPPANMPGHGGPFQKGGGGASRFSAKAPPALGPGRRAAPNAAGFGSGGRASGRPVARDGQPPAGQSGGRAGAPRPPRVTPPGAFQGPADEPGGRFRGRDSARAGGSGPSARPGPRSERQAGGPPQTSDRGPHRDAAGSGPAAGMDEGSRGGPRLRRAPAATGSGPRRRPTKGGSRGAPPSGRASRGQADGGPRGGAADGGLRGGPTARGPRRTSGDRGPRNSTLGGGPRSGPDAGARSGPAGGGAPGGPAGGGSGRGPKGGAAGGGPSGGSSPGGPAGGRGRAPGGGTGPGKPRGRGPAGRGR